MKIAVVDIETTGLSIISDLIVEIGVCELNLANLNCRCLFDCIIKEEGFSEEHKHSWIFYNSNLKFVEVEKAPPLEKFWDILQKIFKKYLVTAYNKKFDFSFLKNRGLKIYSELPCPMVKATNILKIRRNRYEYKYPSVKDAWRYYYPRVPYVEKHRAYDDAVHEALIVYKMFRRGHWLPIIKKSKAEVVVFG